MCWNRVAKLLLSFAVPGALSAAGADDAKPDGKAEIPLSGLPTRAVVSGDHFYAVADGRLMDVDFKQQKAKTFDEVDAKLTPFLDVADGKACVASDGRLHAIDLATGKILRSAEYKGEVRGLGFLGADRVFVLGDSSVAVVDVNSGETLRTVDMAKTAEGDARPRLAGPVGAWQLVGPRLYVATGDRLSVIDLDAGKVLDQMPTAPPAYWCNGVQVVGDRAFLTGVNLSYGINSRQFGFVDLKTRKYTALKILEGKERVPEGEWKQPGLFVGPDGSLCLRGDLAVLQCDGDGRLIGATPLAKDEGGCLVGVWDGRALTAGKNPNTFSVLRLTPLAKAAKGD